MAYAWVGYVPLPGLQAVPALVAPEDRLARFHAWQSAVLVALAWTGALLGSWLAVLLPTGPARAATMALGVWVLMSLVLLTQGLVGALQGRFVRVWPAAWLLGLLEGRRAAN